MPTFTPRVIQHQDILPGDLIELTSGFHTVEDEVLFTLSVNSGADYNQIEFKTLGRFTVNSKDLLVLEFREESQ